jgi:hypothetical protein
MTRDELKQLAREVGAEITDFIDYHYDDEVVVFEKDQLERFAALVAAAERDACVKACKEIVGPLGKDNVGEFWVEKCVAAIRARGESK